MAWRAGERFDLRCVTCDKPLAIICADEYGSYLIDHDPACSKPLVSMMVHHPRQLGIITDIQEPDLT